MKIKEKEELKVWPVGEVNPYNEFFTNISYLASLGDGSFPLINVTFEPGCRNNWHIHHAKEGGGQVLICVDGEGWYQEWGKEPVKLEPGVVVNIPPEVKHWHGAAKDSWMQHVAIEVPGVETSNEWLEPVDDEQYFSLPE